ncbi:MAG TPA: HD domain-containing phosphohydrolase, partial [Blastocatellia bacterium]|nr:HD domain-containing phosphohydrolase [Blastocatellia bacterium]
MESKEAKLLIVDDEEPIRKLLTASLGGTYKCIAAESAEEATRLLGSSEFHIVLTDIRMPGASGLELCQLVHKICPETVVMVISGMTDIHFAIEAMRHGAFDYVTKPFDLPHLMVSVERALRYQGLMVAKRDHEQSLEETVRLRTAELRSLNESLNGMLESLYTNYRSTLRALAGVLETRDIETRGHSDRVVAYTLRIGKELGLSHRDLISLEQGALLHDIGKIGIPDRILLKAGPLTDDEWDKMRQHVRYGLRIIDDIDFLSGAKHIVGEHHEKFDGTGYPNRLRGDAIHLHARIFSVADTFDAITSDRPYRAAQPYDSARTEIMANSGRHFDPRIVKAFLDVSPQEWTEIRYSAKARDYIEKLIDAREIRALIVSLKYRSATTGALNPPPASHSLLNL